MPYNFAGNLEYAIRQKYGTPLIHDIDAIASFDVNAQAAATQINVLPSKTLIPWQAPTVTLTSTATAHTVTVALIVHGRDIRGLDLALPIIFSSVSLAVTTPVALALGYGLAEVELIAFITKSGIGAGDTCSIGYDLGMTGEVAPPPVVLTADEVFSAATLAVAFEKQPTDVTQEGRHWRWAAGGGATKPTPAANRFVMVTTPPFTNI
jgi:hypothetical protein